MEFEEVLKNRRSIRKFKAAEIPDKIIEQILELANLSPSAGNLQARKVVVVKDKKIKEALSRKEDDFVPRAAAVFVVCAAPKESEIAYGERGKNLYALQDATLFASYLQLAVTSLGLASCWVGAFDEERVKKILGLRADLRPIVIIPVGYAAEEPLQTSRKSLKDISIYK
jgi:nitroreductase